MLFIDKIREFPVDVYIRGKDIQGKKWDTDDLEQNLSQI